MKRNDFFENINEISNEGVKQKDEVWVRKMTLGDHQQ
jgi:hypothetical protein